MKMLISLSMEMLLSLNMDLQDKKYGSTDCPNKDILPGLLLITGCKSGLLILHCRKIGIMKIEF